MKTIYERILIITKLENQFLDIQVSSIYNTNENKNINNTSVHQTGTSQRS